MPLYYREEYCGIKDWNVTISTIYFETPKKENTWREYDKILTLKPRW